MGYQEFFEVDIPDIIRYWREGLSQRRIAALTSHSRNTIARYLAAAQELGIDREQDEAPTEQQLARLLELNLTAPANPVSPAQDRLSPFADQIGTWLGKDRLQLVRVQELLSQRGCQVSYTSLRRFVARSGLGKSLPPTTVRMAERAPGQAAEMDFARLGTVFDPEDGRRRAVWMLAVILTYSRHCFFWPLYRQRLEDVVEALDLAWEFFGGVPRYLVIDNFPAAVAGADRHHPRLTAGFKEYARRREFIPDPARSAHPRDKPRVERLVPYIRERFFKGSQFASLSDMRARAPTWCREVAGNRVHGTTRRRPLEVFVQEERGRLRPWDGVPYEIVNWQGATVGR